MCKEHILEPLNNVGSPMWPIFILENSRNTLNIYPLTSSWLLIGHIWGCLKATRSWFIMTIILFTDELLFPAITLVD